MKQYDMQPATADIQIKQFQSILNIAARSSTPGLHHHLHVFCHKTSTWTQSRTDGEILASGSQRHNYIISIQHKFQCGSELPSLY